MLLKTEVRNVTFQEQQTFLEIFSCISDLILSNLSNSNVLIGLFEFDERRRKRSVRKLC